eukprot:5115419-Pleurochrysis_carterae.AAC.1
MQRPMGEPAVARLLCRSDWAASCDAWGQSLYGKCTRPPLPSEVNMHMEANQLAPAGEGVL